VRQVGYLPELYEDARSEKNIKNYNYIISLLGNMRRHKCALAKATKSIS